MKKAYKITVNGTVQGVFFRAHAKEYADKLNLRGLIDNQPDGTVQITVEGEPADLAEFIEWCQEGSPRAQVTNINVVNIEPQNFSSFTIQ